ncbi:cyclic nucleotide-binding domain-containing protein [Marivita geojedonensis]|uniref:Uncharacterized protein n=1 Tax=Marivita geojedonensis TaxID=1123756 RepID=A0A1X4NHD0_9RHOB|nr:hypothetical protein [Marivita geojedonensis]OSQ46978.1 hypothetical protein MGEO_16410 [Marivita geojedonensis]PRY74411.1 hypothetical protein CLV76_12010 [Marivita geojedonensis]
MDDAPSDMTLSLARRFLNAGVWADVASGTLLTEEEAKFTALRYLACEDATVSVRGNALAEIKRSFMGEIGVLCGQPAMAMVQIKDPSRLFLISSDTLSKICRTENEFRWSINQYLVNATKSKLVEANNHLPNRTAQGSNQQ